MAVLQSKPSMQPPLTATTFLPLWFNKPSQRHVAEHGRPIWFLCTYRRRVDQPGAALLAKVTVGKLVSQATRQTTHSVSHTSTWSGPEKSASCNNRSLSGTDSTHTSRPGHSLIALQQLGIWQRESGKDGRGAKRRAGLCPTVSVAYFLTWGIGSRASSLGAYHTHEGENKMNTNLTYPAGSHGSGRCTAPAASGWAS
jgi:hypothetical protein